MLASAGVQPQEQPIASASGLCVVIALMMAVSVEPTYISSPARPGAMPIACVMSRFCSPSSQPLLYAHAVLVPSVEISVTGTLLVWPMFLKYVVRSARSVP